jgi:HSP20 family molecular chaperone IbpA
VDVVETASALWVLVALPGVDAASVRVELQEHELMVCGERALPAEFRSAVVHRLEIPHGRFERRVGLPPGTYEVAQRALQDGCLVLSLLKIA